ncbi:MAG TPA: sigma-70 family RNA polymerase sigma factor [Actinomycetes bacterium]|nr:sigma-70 family RNA polymerase sigma factor [Actinomycetes bacterium]
MALVDPGGFEAFYADRKGALVRALHSIVGHDAEDVAQDAFATLLERWDVVSRYDAPESWLRRIAIRAACRQRQRDASRPRNELLSAVVAREADAPEPIAAIVDDVISKLTASEREALLLRYVSDTSVKELAQHYGCSDAAMRVRLHRARRHAAEEVVGLSGTWVMNASWSSDALARLLEAHGYASAVAPVLAEFADLGDIRTHLHLADGRFLLTNGPDEHLDHGRYTYARGTLRLDSAGYEGGVTYRANIEGDSLELRQLENRNPRIHGAPDDAFQLALVGSSPFSWHPSAT